MNLLKNVLSFFAATALAVSVYATPAPNALVTFSGGLVGGLGTPLSITFHDDVTFVTNSSGSDLYLDLFQVATTSYDGYSSHGLPTTTALAFEVNSISTSANPTHIVTYTGFNALYFEGVFLRLTTGYSEGDVFTITSGQTITSTSNMYLDLTNLNPVIELRLIDYNNDLLPVSNTVFATTAIPEPSTTALLVGFGAIACVATRRKTRA